MRTTFTNRIRIIAGAVVLIAVVLAGRLYFLQIVNGDEYSQRADRQYTQPKEGLFDRGAIFFEDKTGKRLRVATIQNGFTLTLNPSKIENAEETYRKLNSILEIDKEEFLERISKKDDPYEVLAHKLNKEQADKITGSNISGVGVEKEQWRYYPGGELASHVLGFVAFSGDERTGRYGLERYYDDVLRRDKDDSYINFFAEVFSNVGELFADEGGRKGDIVTTIEPTVQGELERKLSEITKEWNSKLSGGIIINPKTGEIYALATKPSFDLNDFSSVKDAEEFSNPLIERVYEMGSIIKSITMASGLDYGSVSPTTTYTDNGVLSLDGGNAHISNYDGRGRGVVDMQRVLGESLNTGVAFVVSRMGNKPFADYIRNFGLGSETGIDLPGEVAGLLDNLESPRDVEYATASFGQGIATTPIATVRALSALGNGGRLITPHIVKTVEYDIGPSKKIFNDEKEGVRVIKEETSEEITRMLVNVVDDFLLGGTVALPEYSIAAKTGTAQISDNVNGGYFDDRFFHSFFGYFPAYDPKFLVFLFTEEPKGARYASQTLTYPFMDLTKFLISYYEVPPDRTPVLED